MPRRRTTRRAKRLTNKKSRRLHRKQRKQCGGGMWESFCVACGRPLYPINFRMLIDSGQVEIEDDDIEFPSTAWMGKNVGYDKDHNVVVLLGADEFYGDAPVLSRQSTTTAARLAALEAEGVNVDSFSMKNQFDAEENEQLTGYVLHLDCLTVLARVYNDISFDFVEAIATQQCDVLSKEFQEQFYNIGSAVGFYGVEHFESPLHNSENRKAILDAPCPFLVEKKREELARRRRIVEAARAGRALATTDLPAAISSTVRNYLRAPTNTRATNLDVGVNE